ncbi:lyase family protein [Mycolicibacterium sp.]|uniref:lyase family protein n=1 Tax=Mycolicibacterium sp. TaxID=2320850 RepID=UPI001A341AED|nr:lyase family protein [Mycolicibacterium sp.]MBJ7336969.1 3-carboxy-cis,cis-muconate cycloisomerase [Mycolicibacterium sp.]
MTDLFWPGDHLAGEAMSDAAFLRAIVTVEQAWLAGLVDVGIAPAAARITLTGYLDADDAEAIAVGADTDGNPVSGAVALLRRRTPEPAARWLHRGLTSQDVVDCALMLCLQEVLDKIAGEVATQVDVLRELADTHRDTAMLARTLTQAALPSTVGVKVVAWLSGLLDATESLADVRAGLPAQIGGAVGTLAAIVELAGSAEAAVALSDSVARALGLAPAPPWHGTRSPITRVGDLLVGCCDAWGHLAADVATGSRTEIGEFAEGHGGGSSTMPHKNNPVRSVLIRRAALTAGPLAATLHTASASSVDERADGAWHAEWATIRTLARRTVVAAVHTSELLAGLRVDAERAAANLAAAGDLGAEQRTMAELAGHQPNSSYLGAATMIVDAALERAARYRKDLP